MTGLRSLLAATEQVNIKYKCKYLDMFGSLPPLLTDLGDLQPGAEQCRDPGQTGGPDDGAGGEREGEGEAGGDDEREAPPRRPPPPPAWPRP